MHAGTNFTLSRFLFVGLASMAQFQRVAILMDRLGSRVWKLSLRCHRGLKTSPHSFQEAEVHYIRFCGGWAFF